MAKTILTAAAVARLKPNRNGKRREIPDAGARGLHLAIEPMTGTKAWGYRYRRPNGKSAVMRLGHVDLSGKEPAEPPKIGDPLSLHSARALVAELERQRLRGVDPGLERQVAKQQARIVRAEHESRLFPAAVRSFINEHTVKGRKPRAWRRTAAVLGLRYATNGGEPEIIQGGLAERWKDRAVNEIVSHDIYALTDESRRFGIPGTKKRTQGLSNARAKKMRDALGALFGFLLEHRKIISDPTSGVWRPGPSAPRTRVLDNHEIRWFWHAAEKVGAPYGQALRLLLLSGCRLREIALLKRSEMPDDFSEIRLVGDRVKNGKPFTVYLPPLAQNIIRSLPTFEGCDYAISGNGRTAGGSWSRVKRSLDAAMLAEARAERGDDVAIPPWTIHDLRRCCASGLQSLGIRSEVIERTLNHISGSFRGVAGIYQRDPLTDEVRVALERWARHVEGLVSDKPTKVIDLDTRRA
jgi:integrase